MGRSWVLFLWTLYESKEARFPYFRPLMWACHHSGAKKDKDHRSVRDLCHWLAAVATNLRRMTNISRYFATSRGLDTLLKILKHGGKASFVRLLATRSLVLLDAGEELEGYGSRAHGAVQRFLGLPKGDKAPAASQARRRSYARCLCLHSDLFELA